MRNLAAAFATVALALGVAPFALANGDEHGHGDEPLFDSGSIPVGQSYELQMWKAGPLPYHCHPHPWMVGTVEVGAAEGEFRTFHVNVTDDGTYAGAFAPDALEARVGDTVVWYNNGTMPHTVTSDEEQAPHAHADESGDSPSVGAVAAVVVLLVPLLLRRRGR